MLATLISTSAYALHGLTIHSELPLLDLPVSGAPADVRVRFGKVSSHLDACQARGVLFEATPGKYLLRVDGVARYLVDAGREIVIDPAPGASEDELRLFLFGSPSAALLHQRGVLALHAAAIRTPLGAVLFAGQSGVGKSTLLTALLDRGYPPLADDLVAVTIDQDNLPNAHSGVGSVRLWADAAAMLGRSPDDLRRVRPDVEKFALSPPVPVEPQSMKLAKLYVLEAHNEDAIRVELLSNSARFNAIASQTKNLRVFRGLGDSVGHFRTVAAVAQAVPVARVRRPRYPCRLEELADRIEADMRQ